MKGEQKNAILGAVSLLVIGVAAYLYFRPSQTVTFPTTYRIDGVCLACKAEQNSTADLKSPQPFECSSCGEKAVFSWLYCNDCKKRFIPDITVDNGTYRLPIMPSCTGCRKTNVTQFASDDPDQHPVGDVPPPKWPL